MIRLLNSVGKRRFVQFFYQFRDLNENDLINLLIDNGISNFNGARRRVINAKELFNRNLQIQALENIQVSMRLNIEIRERAGEILDEINN